MNYNKLENFDKLDKIIQNNYSASFMSNTKWDKLLDRLTDTIESLYLYYKLIHSDKVESITIWAPDFKPFFIEPILYKELEWIEFPKEYEDYVNRNHLKMGKKYYTQNILTIYEKIELIGHFEMEVDDDKIRLFGYK